MKKNALLLALFLVAVMVIPAPSVATPIPDFIYVFDAPVSYPSPVDSIIAYGGGSPNDASEKDYFRQALGFETVADLLEEYDYYKDPAEMGQKELDLFNPGFSWDYALIKVDGPNDYWYMFIDDNALGGDDLFTTPEQGTLISSALELYYNFGDYGISHASYLIGDDITVPPPPQVPEPSTLLLIGTGVLGLGIFGRRKFQK